MNSKHALNGAKLLRVNLVSPITDEDVDGQDIFVHLTDGRIYAMDVSTPGHLVCCMDNDEPRDFLVGCPPIIVRKMTVANIEAAVLDILSDESGERLGRYGYLQESSEDSDEST